VKTAIIDSRWVCRTLTDYDVLDWLAEDLVDNAPAAMPKDMVAQRMLVNSPGLLVVPALDRRAFDNPESMMAKLARGYL